VIKVYGINSCSSFKKGVKYFKKHKIEIETYDLKVTVPTKEEMKNYHEQSGLEIKKFFNTSGKLYRELEMKNKYKSMSLDDIYDILSQNGMLIKRPLVIDKDHILVGYDEEKYDEIWNKN
jgi:arsenate reductase